MAIDSQNSGALIETQVQSMLVEPLAAESIVLNAGPTLFNSSAPVRVPTITGDTGATWVAENEQIPEGTAPTWGELELMPTDRKSLKVIVRVSNELIRMAKIGVSSVLQNKIVADMQGALDDALLTGTGTANEITGILNQPGVETAPFNADVDSILDGLAHMAANEKTPNKIFMSGADFFAIRKLKDGHGQYLLQPDVTQAGAYQLQGIPVTATNKLAAGTAIMADMKDIAVVRDEHARVDLLTERYAEFDQVGIRVATRYDLGLIRDTGALILSNGA